jgi:hypothetical protein
MYFVSDYRTPQGLVPQMFVLISFYELHRVVQFC